MRCAVLGDPISHSLSPTLHRAGYAAVGLDWQYDAIRVTAEEFPAFVLGRGPEWRGLSLTMPHKRNAMAFTHGRVTDRAGLALCDLGAETVRLLARTPDRAESAAQAIAAHPSGPRVEVLPLTADVLG